MFKSTALFFNHLKYHICVKYTSIFILIQLIKNDEDVSNIDTSSITDMSGLFEANSDFNQNLSKLDTYHVGNMHMIFADCDILDENKPKHSRLIYI